MRGSSVPAILSAAAILLTCAYSGYTINGVLASNAFPTVQFTLGTVHRDVPYCNLQTMDIFIPIEPSGRLLPVVLYAHGSFQLSTGDKSDINPVFLNALARAGFAVASVNYRLAPQYKFPAQIEDVKCAVRFLRANAQTFGFDANEIFAFGDSSGGYLVALAATTNSTGSFDVGSYLNEASSIRAAVDMFGPANLTELIPGSDPVVQRVFGSESNLEFASPTFYVSAAASPLLIIHGVNDTLIPLEQSVQLFNELRSSGAQTQIILVQNAGHEFVQVGLRGIAPTITDIAQDMVNFFEQHAGAVM